MNESPKSTSSSLGNFQKWWLYFFFNLVITAWHKMIFPIKLIYSQISFKFIGSYELRQDIGEKKKRNKKKEKDCEFIQ